MSATFQIPVEPTTASSAAEVEWIDPLSGAAWDDQVVAAGGHSVFHRSAWAKVLAETYGHRPCYVRIRVAGRPAALVPIMEVRSAITGRRGVALPFSDAAEPLWLGAPRAAAVFVALKRLAASRHWRYLEIRGSRPVAPGVPAERTFRMHRLDLTTGAEELHRQLAPAVRRAIRRAVSARIHVTAGTGGELLDEFYQLHCRTRRRHGLPPQPRRFFSAIQRHLLATGHGETLIARHGRRAVAGAVFLHSEKVALYKFGASDPEYWPLRPNHLVMWTAIERLAAAGMQTLDFGRSDASDAGLARFKRSWAAAEETLGYFRYHVRRAHWLAPAASPRAGGHPAIFGRLPLALNRCAGSLIYPHLD